MILCVLVSLSTIACRTQKKGCPVNERNKGAEKVLEEMSNPPKKGLFHRRH